MIHLIVCHNIYYVQDQPVSSGAQWLSSYTDESFAFGRSSSVGRYTSHQSPTRQQW